LQQHGSALALQNTCHCHIPEHRGQVIVDSAVNVSERLDHLMLTALLSFQGAGIEVLFLE
jgi:hypothetical protein